MSYLVRLVHATQRGEHAASYTTPASHVFNLLNCIHVYNTTSIDKDAKCVSF